MSNEIIRTLRGMAWERAKGELHAMLQTFWQEAARTDQYDAAKQAINEFVDKVENDGLHE